MYTMFKYQDIPFYEKNINELDVNLEKEIMCWIHIVNKIELIDWIIYYPLLSKFDIVFLISNVDMTFKTWMIFKKNEKIKKFCLR